MENIAHTLAGLAMAKAGLGRSTRFATAALVIGSNLPDIDAVMLLKGKLAYIDAHRALTHSFLGGAVLALALGALLWAWDRWGLSGQGAVPARMVVLIALSGLGVFVHVGFDLLNDYGVRLLLPFSSRWYYGDVIFVVDPWFWLLLGGALHLSQEPRPLREALVWSGWGLLSVPVLFDPAVSMPARGVWLLGLSALAACRFAQCLRRFAPGAVLRGGGGISIGGRALQARVAIGIVALYCLGAGLLHAHALRQARSTAERETRGHEVRRLALLPMPADPLHWNLIYERDQEIVADCVPPWNGPARDARCHLYSKNLDRPEVVAALSTPLGEVAHRFCRYLFADVRETPRGRDVAFRDARFAIRGRHEFSMFIVPAPSMPSPPEEAREAAIHGKALGNVEGPEQAGRSMGFYVAQGATWDASMDRASRLPERTSFLSWLRTGSGLLSFLVHGLCGAR